MSNFSEALSLNKEIVRAAYNFMLRREPDSEESVDKAVAHFNSVDELERSIRSSDEWKARQLNDSLNTSSQKITKFYSQRGLSHLPRLE